MVNFGLRPVLIESDGIAQGIVEFFINDFVKFIILKNISRKPFIPVYGVTIDT